MGLSMLQQDHRPVCVLSGTPATISYMDRLLSIVLSDEAGFISDTVSITLDNRDQTLFPPVPGDKINVLLGYGFDLSDKGVFVVDEVEVSGPPETMVIGAKATDVATLKTAKTRRWPKGKEASIALGDIVKKIAGEHGLDFAIADSLKDIQIKACNQVNESDINFLSKVAKDYNVVFKVGNEKLLLLKRGESATADGKMLGLVELKQEEITSYCITNVQRNNYKSVEAFWRKTSSGTQGKEVAGSGEPVLKLRHTCKDKADAKTKAKARLDELQRTKKQLKITIPGNAAIVAETPLLVSGVNPLADGPWVTTKVVHRFDNSGFVTEIEAELPGMDKKPSKPKKKKSKKKVKKKKKAGKKKTNNIAALDRSARKIGGKL